MNRNRAGLPYLAVAVAVCLAGKQSLAQAPASQDVVAQRITAPRASPKVAAVLWTRRTDHYTLQVVFPRSSAVQTQKHPAVTLWLLGADGTAIPASQDAPPPGNISEISYSVSLSSGQSAVAVALKVDDEYFIEKLKPLD